MEWFWWLILMGCLAWYICIAFYVGYRGLIDIREMFAMLAARQARELEEGGPGSET